MRRLFNVGVWMFVLYALAVITLAAYIYGVLAWQIGDWRPQAVPRLFRRKDGP